LKAAINIIIALSMGVCVAVQSSNVVGTYEATVPFTGHDPRFAGQEYVWRLELKADSTFSFSTELPMAIYLETPPCEMVTKAPSQMAGTWTAEGDTVLLTRQSGDSTVGSSSTLSFSFVNNCLKIIIQTDDAVISEGEKRLELTKTNK